MKLTDNPAHANPPVVPEELDRMVEALLPSYDIIVGTWRKRWAENQMCFSDWWWRTRIAKGARLYTDIPARGSTPHVASGGFVTGDVTRMRARRGKALGYWSVTLLYNHASRARFGFSVDLCSEKELPERIAYRAIEHALGIGLIPLPWAPKVAFAPVPGMLGVVAQATA